MNWRTLGDTTLEAFSAKLPRNSEIVRRGEVEAVYNAASSHTRLVLGMLKAESSYATHFARVPASMNNPLNMRVRRQEQFQSFSSIALSVLEWNNRLNDPLYAYRDTETVRDLVEIYAPSDDGNDVDGYVATVEAVVESLPVAKREEMGIVFGRVPHPEFEDRQITKPAGVGQDNLGKRTPKSVVWHRMLGSLNGTDNYFRNPTVKALTDYGVGVAAIDGNSFDGVIYRWNSPYGYQSGWASGRVIAPYGDGLDFVTKYGVDAVNRDQVSIEISGYYETGLSEKSRQSIAELTAHFADQNQIPWDVFPIAPQDGFSFVKWHQEFTGPAEKVCPGQVVIEETNDLIERTRAIMKLYQETGAPTPTKRYASADVPKFLKDDNGLNVEKINNTPVLPISMVFTVLRETPRRQGATPNELEIGPPLKVGDRFRAARIFRSHGDTWVLTRNGSRVAARDLTPTVEISGDGLVSVQFGGEG